MACARSTGYACSRPVRRIEHPAGQMLAHGDRGKPFEHRHIDALAFTAACAVIQRGGDGIGDLQANDAVGQDHRCVARRLRAALLHQPGNTGHALDQIVICRTGGIGSALAETHRADIDDARIDRAQIVVPQTQACHRPRPDIVDQHIGPARHAQQRVAPLRLLQIYDDRPLTAVGAEIKMPHAWAAHGAGLPHHVAVRRLDFDHIRAVIAENLGGIRPHHNTGQIKNAHTL